MHKFTWVDKETCIACGACEANAPKIFGCDEEGIAEVIFDGDGNSGETVIPPELEDDLNDAVDNCPTSSIHVATTAFKMKN